MFEDDGPEYDPVVFGTTSTYMVIPHKDAANRQVEFFVDGWVSAKKGYTRTRARMSDTDSGDWQYGFEMASSKRYFFSQALHSFYKKLEAEKRL